MNQPFQNHLSTETQKLREQGLFKIERTITSPQQPQMVANGKKVVCLCANNYLGLANHPALRQAAKDIMDTHGFGMASVRFICGKQDIHAELERQAGGVPGHGGRPALLQLLRRQRRRVRAA